MTDNAATPSGTDAAAFDPNGPSLPTALAPGQSIALTVTATIDAAARTCSAQLTLDTDQTEPLVVPITLKAVDPTWTLAPTPSAFGSTPVGDTGPTHTVSVANAGLVPISVRDIDLNGTNPTDFVIATNACRTTIAACASCYVRVAFTPHGTGSRTASLGVTTEAGANAVALTGTAKNPADVSLWLSGPTTATADARTISASVTALNAIDPDTGDNTDTRNIT